MPIDHYQTLWAEAEEPTAMQAPTSDPTTGASAGNPAGPVPQQGGQGPGPALMGSDGVAGQPPEEDDITKDPQAPEMPDEDSAFPIPYRAIASKSP